MCVALGSLLTRAKETADHDIELKEQISVSVFPKTVNDALVVKVKCI